MPQFEMKLTAILQKLENGTWLAEALFYPELSCYSDRPKQLLHALKVNAARVLKASPALEIHRRHFVGEPRAEWVELEITPPKHTLTWRSPILLKFPVLQWEQGNDAHLTYVPVLGIEIIAPNEEDQAKRVQSHLRAYLMRNKLMSLPELLKLQRCRRLHLQTLTFEVNLHSPKQLAIRAEAESEKEKSTLREVAVDLCKQRLTEAYEVEDHLPRIAEVLTERPTSSVLLIGPAGVGKTAVIHELVRRRADFQMGNVPFWSTSGSRLVAGQSGFGMWQERCQHLCREARQKKIILHLGNLMELMEVGKSVMQNQSIASFLRPYVQRGDLLTIAECTPEQKVLIEKNEPQLLQAFTEIVIEEPDRERGLAMLTSEVVATALRRARSQSDLPVTNEGIATLDALHRRYATYSAWPGRPLRFLKNLLADQPEETVLDSSDVTAAFSRETGLPRFLLDEKVPLELDKAREWFQGRVLGQSEAVDLIVDLLTMVKARLTRPRKPIASLMFIGPTGVGKTEMAKALAEMLFGSRDRLTRFDMSEHNDVLSVQRLIGGLGSKEGLLTAKIREQPFSVVLLDEIEKADPMIFDVLLQVLGEGRLTDASGRLADFCNSVVIMTSNLGAASYQQGAFGFTDRESSARELQKDHAREHFISEVQKVVRPELFNRIDRVVPFMPLDEETILHVAELQLRQLQQRDGILYRGVDLSTTPEVAHWLAKIGFDARYGARPLKRAIEREMLAPLSESMNAYVTETPLRASVDVKDNALDVVVRARTDEAGRLLSATGSEQVMLRRIESLRWLRRRIQRLQRCTTMVELTNEIYRLQRTEEIRQRKKRPMTQRDAERVQKLTHLTRLRDEVNQRFEEASQLETDLLVCLYQQQPIEEIEVDPLNERWTDLILRMYLRRFRAPNRVTLAIFGESTPWVFELTRAYYRMVTARGGTVELWQYLATMTKVEERQVPQRRQWVYPEVLLSERDQVQALAWDYRIHSTTDDVELVSAHEKVIGFVMSVGMQSALPLLQPEEGRHVLRASHGAGDCLVEVSPLPASDRRGLKFYYQPPDGIERRGTIGPQPRRRTYHASRSEVEDDLTRQRLPYDPDHLEQFLETTLEAQLTRNAESILNS